MAKRKQSQLRCKLPWCQALLDGEDAFEAHMREHVGELVKYPVLEENALSPALAALGGVGYLNDTMTIPRCKCAHMLRVQDTGTDVAEFEELAHATHEEHAAYLQEWMRALTAALAAAPPVGSRAMEHGRDGAPDEFVTVESAPYIDHVANYGWQIQVSGKDGSREVRPSEIERTATERLVERRKGR